eukprot:CAMPEP_0114587658 /NCGR_PEP_ID=MMETSP0125-20121206/10567_1 /TAXON_ID=485358 ORGANISM="Aristerostoma sp., Strain ATCC 50986" /NCGR_SAMPLE_ID=MMETSP0125 /ASSEMBLY_ACC=CAM_ASM_000245 /LENGTH=187 /DNA_ID=CAMNT_0001783687 /DNA_START=747 /DNA_END=1310 /DNA_ORIENTATION=+
MIRSNEKVSELILGGFDHDDLDSRITWSSVKGDGYWSVELQDVLLGGQSLNLCHDGCIAIIDSGTSTLTAPTPHLQGVMEKIQGYECKDIDQVPALSFKIEGKVYDLKPEDYIATSDGKYMYTYEHPPVDQIVDCAPQFMAFDAKDEAGRPIWILGDTFMSSLITIFDVEAKRVGFAEPNLADFETE